MTTLRFYIALMTVSLLASSLFAGDPSGVWRWTMSGRNGQPQENTLKLNVAKDGSVSGSLSDRTGTTAISNGGFKGNQLEFSVVREIPGGKVETTYTAQLTGDKLTGTSVRPDKAPGAAASGKKRQADWIATREPAKPKG